MGREVLPLTVDRLGDLTGTCADCIFWELDPRWPPRRSPGVTPAWTRSRGCPRRCWNGAAWADRVRRRGPAGYVTYAPPHLVPRAARLPDGALSREHVLLMTARVDPEFAGQGLGRVLIQGAAKDVMRRGVRAVEVFGYLGDPDSHRAPV